MDKAIVEQYYNHLKSINKQSREYNLLKMTALCHFNLLENIDKEIKQSKDKEDIQNLIAEAISITHGPGYALTSHGVFKTIYGQFTSDYLPVIIDVFNEFSEKLSKGFGIDSFITSGTLLGLVREGAFIPHDDDFDLAYVSRESFLPNVLLERKDLLKFIRSLPDFKAVECTGAHFHVYFNGRGAQPFRFDLFTAWVDKDGYFNEYPLRPEILAATEVLPLAKASFYEGEVAIPRNAEAFLELNYGSDWRIPNPLFHFPWGLTAKFYSYLTGNKLPEGAVLIPDARATFDYLPVLTAEEEAQDDTQFLSGILSATPADARPNLVVIGKISPAVSAFLTHQKDRVGQVWNLGRPGSPPTGQLPPLVAHDETSTPDIICNRLSSHTVDMVILGDEAEAETLGYLDALLPCFAPTTTLVLTHYEPAEQPDASSQNAVWWRFADSCGRRCRFVGRTHAGQVVAKVMAS